MEFLKKSSERLVKGKEGLIFVLAMPIWDCGFGAVVQLVRIPACHAGGREFESRPHREFFNTPLLWMEEAFFI